MVVLDNLLMFEERKQLLDFITAPGHDSAALPPSSSWEANCVDRPGDQATWGLKEEVVQRLQEDPPPALKALAARLQVRWARMEDGGCFTASFWWMVPCTCSL